MYFTDAQIKTEHPSTKPLADAESSNTGSDQKAENSTNTIHKAGNSTQSTHIEHGNGSDKTQTDPNQQSGENSYLDMVKVKDDKVACHFKDCQFVAANRPDLIRHLYCDH